MQDDGIELPNDETLEDWLKNKDDACFPAYTPPAEKKYPKKYQMFKDALGPIHDEVEKGALAKGALEWIAESEIIVLEIDDHDEQVQLLEKLWQADPIVYLNNHGKGHVEKVIIKVSEMLHLFESGHLTPYEGFFLLCAIQVHDIGNIFGRAGHEDCKQIIESKGEPFIPDAFERGLIQKLAIVHGGSYNGDPDTISLLSENKMLFDRNVRKRLLAALLRFGDELADDSSRADKEGLENNTIIPGSEIYHRYSAALHTVKIKKEKDSEKLQVFLSFQISSSVAKQQFMKNGTSKYLLDEIYDRTLKMERERRYCMRYMRPYFSLDGIRVEIVIQDESNAFNTHSITYSLAENGYPPNPASGHIKEYQPLIRSGEEEKQYIENEWDNNGS